MQILWDEKAVHVGQPVSTVSLAIGTGGSRLYEEQWSVEIAIKLKGKCESSRDKRKSVLCCIIAKGEHKGKRICEVLLVMMLHHHQLISQ